MDGPLAVVEVDAGRTEGREKVGCVGGMVVRSPDKLMLLCWCCVVALMLMLCCVDMAGLNCVFQSRAIYADTSILV